MPTSTPPNRQTLAGTEGTPKSLPHEAPCAAPIPARGRAEQAGPAKPPRNNLVLARSPLIGREHEAAVVQFLLLQEAVGLLTLTGPGGIGKTRLALQVAANVLDNFVDGVYFVSLAPIRDPERVGEAIAHALGVQEAAGQALLASVKEHLRDKQLLLVLDNFEQVAAAGALVGELLAECGRLKVLATSRTVLHVYGEQKYSVPPLALPEREAAADIERLAVSAAVALFVQRAVEVQPDFALNGANAAAVAAICIDLDGLPLAIELAAAKLKLFSPPALLARLRQRLALLTGGPHDAPQRQRTLRDEIAWSYELLTPDEQVLFRRLAIFAGGFCLDAAEAVGNAGGNAGDDGASPVLDTLEALVDQNMVKRGEEGDGEPRFGMLETIREFGLEQLAASGEGEAIYRLYAGYYTALAEAFRDAGVNSDGEALLKRLHQEHANLGVALEWSQGKMAEPQIVLRLVAALRDFWMAYAFWREGRYWTEFVLTLTIPPELAALRAQVLVGAGCMAILLNDPQRGRERLEQGLELARELGMQRLVAQALIYLSFVAHGHEHDDAKANRLLEQVMSIGQAMGDKNIMAESLLFRGGLARDAHDYVRAQALCEEALGLYRELGTAFGSADALSVLGEVAQLQHDYPRARRFYRESLLNWRAVGTFQWKGVAICVEGLADVCAAEQQFEAAAQLLGASEALRAALGTSAPPVAGAATASKVAALRAQMDEAVFTAARAKGQALVPQQAVEYALAIEEPAAATSVREVGVAPQRASYPASLTTREVEVLRLLAQGLTYAEIAAQLVVTHRTVNGHVTSIYSKIGVNNRAAATRFAAAHGFV